MILHAMHTELVNMSCSNRVLGLSDGLHDINYLNWRLTLCFLATWVIVCLCLIKGVKSLGKVRYHITQGFVYFVRNTVYIVEIF